jgi:superfamily II DNA/RNA helicase
VEHKAYLHRSGRTARAGKSGTVITLMTDDQVREVRTLTRAAGVRPITTRIDTVADPILGQLAPGRRVSRHAPERPNAAPERSGAPRRNRVGAAVRQGHSAAQFSSRARRA